MFDRFRPYFSIFVGALPSVFVIPLTIRLHRYPSVLAAAFQLLWSIFRPVATVHMLTLGLIFILWNPRSIVRMRDSSLIAFFALPVPISLFVTFHEMWLVTGNGNPNYLFFQCFAYGLFVAVILLDVVSATVKRDKVRRMADKGEFTKKVVEAQRNEKGGLDTTIGGKASSEQTSVVTDASRGDANSVTEQHTNKPVVVFL
jgi:phosphatidylinositol glycan class U